MKIVIFDRGKLVENSSGVRYYLNRYVFQSLRELEDEQSEVVQSFRGARC